jgi:hypothetical protein
MEKRRSVPVLISFKKLQLSEKVNPTHKSGVDVTDEKRSTLATHLGQRRNLPLRSFSLHSILTQTNATLRVGNGTELKNVSNAELEIERFERDFVLPLLKNVESDKSCLTRTSGVDNSDGILNDKAKRFHSSSDSLPTDTDSGIFSRLSDSTDSDSESSIVIPNKLQEYSDNDIDEGLKSDNKPSLLHFTRSKIGAKRKSHNQKFSQKPSSTPISIHKTEDCDGTVTINGLCYHCI